VDASVLLRSAHLSKGVIMPMCLPDSFRKDSYTPSAVAKEFEKGQYFL
jgi:hypothetical protein